MTFDLDALERESTPEPFTFTVKGENFAIADVQEHDWQGLLTVGEDIEANLRMALGDAEYDRFKAIRGVPSWRLERLVRAMTEHFGLGAPGEDGGSSGS